MYGFLITIIRVTDICVSPIKVITEWSQKYSVDVPYIDDQHKQLLAIIDNFNDEYANDKTIAGLSRICTKLIKYAECHFRDEEELMSRTPYPLDKIAQHKKMHEKLVEDIFKINEELVSDVRRAPEAMKSFLENWLLAHILSADKDYQSFVKHLPDFQPTWKRATSDDASEKK